MENITEDNSSCYNCFNKLELLDIISYINDQIMDITDDLELKDMQYEKTLTEYEETIDSIPSPFWSCVFVKLFTGYYKLNLQHKYSSKRINRLTNQKNNLLNQYDELSSHCTSNTNCPALDIFDFNRH